MKILDAEQASTTMITANTLRVYLTPLEEARAYQKRMTQFGLTVEEVAEGTKMPLRRVKERLDLLNLEPKIQDLVHAGQFPLGHARLLRHLDPARQIIAMQTYNKGAPGGGTMTVATFRAVVAKLQSEQDYGFDMSGVMVYEDVDADKRAAEAAAEAAAAKRKKDRETILGTEEIADRFGVKPATVQQWKARKHLPPPDHVLGRVPVWYESTLDGWKPPGRTRKMLGTQDRIGP